MAQRSHTPDIDILDALTGENSTAGSGVAPSKGFAFDANDILDLNDPEGSGDDAAFISKRQAAYNRKSSTLKGRTVKKGGGFQAMGLDPNLLKAITRKGFSVPTPIQRKTIPLILEGRDVVGMARTGSGKTAAFVVPMIQQLKSHSPVVGARALVMSPTRELALQTLQVVKEMSRGTDLKHVILVGGDSLEEQFGSVSNNPDIIIATPGRFLHLKVEMSLDLSSMQYVVFDEADRLFEMGFANDLAEILHALPTSRQTLLFSATLPTSLFEFARAGLQEPQLVRLDADTKISPDLENAFFGIIPGEKDAALLQVLQDLIQMPIGAPKQAEEEIDKKSKKRKRADRPSATEMPTEHSTILFAATKHRVEYLTGLLTSAGFAVSFAYSALDQTARRIQVENFRCGRTNILIATDVAARGIDIPVLANVINYDFPPQPKIFIHRVGRTARAGQRGRSYSLVTSADAPYLLDLQLFLGKELVVGRTGSTHPSLTDNIVLGALPRDRLGTNVEWRNRLVEESYDLTTIESVAEKAEIKYMKTRNSASHQSVKRSRELVRSTAWTSVHPLFPDGAENDDEARRLEMLAKISNYRPKQTVFEFEARGKGGRYQEAAKIMQDLRKTATPNRDRSQYDSVADKTPSPESGDDSEPSSDEDAEDVETDDNDGLEVSISNNSKSKSRSNYKDSEFYISYTPRNVNVIEEQGYGVNSGGTQRSGSTSFVEAARDATMDLANDEVAKAFGQPTRAKSQMRWDKRSSRYVARANDEDGTRGAKLVRGESGVKLPASLQSGRFDRWRRDNRLGRLPRVGDVERAGGSRGEAAGKRFKHKQEKAPKEADKFRDDYHVRKKRVQEAKEKRVGKFKDGFGSSRKELKSTEDVKKQRKVKELKRAKNARPTKGRRK